MSTSLRDRLKQELNAAMRAKDSLAVSTLRLILAALKDRDIAARGKGLDESIGETEIFAMLQTMVRQRRDSIEQYEKGKRPDLARQEAQEIVIIERFLPARLSDNDVQKAVKDLIDELGATNLKDMGRTMAALRERYVGQMDFAKASGIVKGQLT